jgi:hypothetical protein
MTNWSKEKKFKSCLDCHLQLAPKYQLRDDGLSRFQRAEGR